MMEGALDTNLIGEGTKDNNLMMEGAKDTNLIGECTYENNKYCAVRPRY